MRIVRTLAFLVVALALATSAWADKQPAKTETKPAATKKPNKRPKRYRSAQRIPCEHGLALGKWSAECGDEFRKDKMWRKQWVSVIKRDLKPDVHKSEARRVATNNKHVVMAYAGIWIIVAGLLLLIWLRQSKLIAEISRLEQELQTEITKDEGPGADPRIGTLGEG